MKTVVLGLWLSVAAACAVLFLGMVGCDDDDDNPPHPMDDDSSDDDIEDDDREDDDIEDDDFDDDNTTDDDSGGSGPICCTFLRSLVYGDCGLQLNQWDMTTAYYYCLMNVNADWTCVCDCITGSGNSCSSYAECVDECAFY